MPRVKIETFAIKAKKRQSRDDKYFALNDIEGNHILDIFGGYLRSLTGRSGVSEAQKTVLTFEPNSLKTGRRNDGRWFIAGRVRVGDFGIANPIVNVDTLEPSFDKSRRDSELFPLYFVLCGADGWNHVVGATQRFGTMGFSSQLKKTFSSYVLNNFHEYTIPIIPLVPKDLLEAMVNSGDISQVILRRNNLPRNAIDRLRAKGFTENVRKMEVSFKGDGEVFPKSSIRGWIRDPEARFITIEELRDFGIDGDHDVLVKVNINGVPREIDFGNNLKLRPYIDINDSLEFDQEGHPKFESIHRETLTLCFKILSDELE